MSKYRIENGNLLPVEKITLSQEEFSLFNESLSNKTRDNILNGYNCIISKLKEYCEDEFIIWVYGSFLTNKEEPNDMDLKIFLSERDKLCLMENKFIERIYQIMNDMKLDILFYNFLPKGVITKENNSKLNEQLVLLHSRRNGDEICENCTGYFEIVYLIENEV